MLHYNAMTYKGVIADVAEGGEHPRIMYFRDVCESMDISDVSRRTGRGVEVDLQVSPRSSRSGIEGLDTWRKRLIVRVKAPPLEGRANEEVEEVFKDVTGCKAQVTAGHTSRQKTVLIEGDADAICSKLNAAL